MNWGAGQRVEEKLSSPFRDVTSDTPCWSFETSVCTPYANMFYHFTGGKNKPWMVGPPEGYSDADQKWQSPWHFWFYQLGQVNEELGMNLHFSQLDRGEAEATETISGYELDVLHGPECVYKSARRNDGIGVWTLIRGQVAERSNRAAVRNYPNLN
jgi:hypothetical protein